MKKWIYRLVMMVCFTLCACMPALSRLINNNSLSTFIFTVLAIATLWFCISPSYENKKLETKRLTVCGNGAELLLAFSVSTFITVCAGFAHIKHIYLPEWSAFTGKVLSIRAWTWWDFIFHIKADIIVGFITLAVVFWFGIIRVYLTSEQLGIRYRVWGFLLGLVPIVHLYMLFKITGVCLEEVKFEQARLLKEKARKNQKICQTKYPIVMVHGVFFRDSRATYLNYWGRVPAALKNNGATIYHGNQESAGSLEFCGAQLKKRIEQIVSETGCEKVNVIAHSKGGLDTRMAIRLMGDNPLIASLTTVATPHRGCKYADYLLNKIPKSIQDKVENTYNRAYMAIGDDNPDFMKAVWDLTASRCEEFNKNTPDSDKVYYQSVGSEMKRARSGRFPLNVIYYFVKHYEGHNDGLVGEESSKWGENYIYLKNKGTRGISHTDTIDLYRENIKGFDVREFYIQLVADLKKKGF